MTWDLEKKNREHTMYPVQYPCNHTTTTVPGLRPTAKLVRTMAQDLVKKKIKNKKINEGEATK